MDQDRYEPLPSPRITFEPRQTLDILVGGSDGERITATRLRPDDQVELGARRGIRLVLS